MRWFRPPECRAWWKPSAGVLVAVIALSSATARADDVNIRYTLKLIGVPLGAATFFGDVTQASYKIQLTAKLTGVATVVSNARGAATASGAIIQGRVAPNGFATTSANANMTRTIRIAMSQGNVRASEIVPPFGSPPDRIPVTEAHKRNVVDPLSGLVMPLPVSMAQLGPAACDRKVPVFDGWTRFDIGMEFRGMRDIHLKGYSGPVAVCGVRYTPVSGHRDRPMVRYMAENKDMEVWLAPIGQTRVAIPLRIAVQTTIGMLTIDATDFSAIEKSAQR